jgi:hypothetical protein
VSVAELVDTLRRTDTVFTWELRGGVVFFGYHRDLRETPPSIPLPYGFNDPLLLECLEWHLAQVRRGT